MSVLIKVGSRKAYLRWGRWVSADIRLEASLNELTRQWFQEGGPPIDDPDQEVAVAREIARRARGRVLCIVKSDSRRLQETYIARRQMSLDFSGGNMRVGRRG